MGLVSEDCRNWVKPSGAVQGNCLDPQEIPGLHGGCPPTPPPKNAILLAAGPGLLALWGNEKAQLVGLGAPLQLGWGSDFGLGKGRQATEPLSIHNSPPCPHRPTTGRLVIHNLDDRRCGRAKRRKEILSSRLGSELLNSEVYFIKNKKEKGKKLDQGWLQRVCAAW